MFSDFFIVCEDSHDPFLCWPLYFTSKPVCLIFTTSWGSRGAVESDRTREIMLLIFSISVWELSQPTVWNSTFLIFWAPWENGGWKKNRHVKHLYVMAQRAWWQGIGTVYDADVHRRGKREALDWHFFPPERMIMLGVCQVKGQN